MVMSVLYVLALLASGVGWIIARRAARPFPSLAPVFVGLVMSYALAMTALCIDPYYEDNGLPEFIEWRFRWAWAAEFAGWFAIVVVPLVLAAKSLADKLQARRQP